MKNISQLWNSLDQKWFNKSVLLFLDYDGTLAPIASVPEEAFLPKENKRLLQLLAKVSSCQIVIISGRALKDLKEMVGIEGIIYCGNHGWEIEGPEIHFESLISPDIAATMDAIKYELVTKLSDVEGAFVEDKGMTLSVHYRQVPQEKEVLVKKISHQIWQDYQEHNKVRISSGKKVLEVRPPGAWDKGKVALWLLRKQEILKGAGNVIPLYIGDDMTDEDSFKSLRDKGMTVVVGEGQHLTAEYCLKGTQQVTQLLKQIVERAYEEL